MDWVAPLLKLAHLAVAMALVGGLIGRWIVLSRAAATNDVERSAELAEAAGPFERLVIRSGNAVLPLGLVTAWAQGYPWLGLTTGWMLASILLLLPLIALVPLVFIPRGKLFESELAAARTAGTMTDGLRAAWRDPRVAMARRYEVAAIALVVALMVLKPF
jgi:uncharacterized membrane protein